MGHKVSKKGTQPMDDKVEVITNAPSATNVSELKSYVGLISFIRERIGIGAEKNNKRLKNQSCS